MESLKEICDALLDSNWSMDNLFFGSGGALLQRLDRDTLRCAYKCCMAEINGQQVDVFKQPVTDLTKQSKRGNLTLVRQISDGKVKTTKKELIGEDEIEMLQVVFENGQLVVEYDMESVRESSNF